MTFITAGWLTISSLTLAAHAQEGVPVTVEVKDENGDVVPTAVVRHPKEKQQHKVNSETGRWTERVLYMDDGSEFIFTKGEVLVFEVSAPGFKNEFVTFVVRKRKNVIPVRLERFEIDLTEDHEMSPNINFGRDTPLDK